ncbi:transketolase [Paenibacillus sp. P26]|nr:transketolase [Paenibacillus sp. P26]
MRNTFIKYLTEQAEKDDRIFVITPDLGFSVLEQFEKKFPDRFINVGIAEQNAVSVATGLALSGKIVYVYSIVPFVTMRCFEQVRVDVAYMNTNVRLVGVGAGLSYGPAGATHHAIEDISVMRSLPNMTVCCPGDPIEVREITLRSFDHQGPMYIRLGKNGEPCIHSSTATISIGKAIRLTEGKDVCILTTSNMLEEGQKLVERLKASNKSASLISFPTIKPLDHEMITELINKKIPIVTLEEHNIIGGLGTAVSEVIAESGKGVPFLRFGIKDQFCHYVGSQMFLRNKLIMEDTWNKIFTLLSSN